MSFFPLLRLRRLLLLLLLLCLLNFTSQATDLNSDREALLEFISSVPHIRKLNWNASTPVCSTWVGVSCNPNHTRVVAVRLPGVGLFGNLPPDTIGKLDSLTVLSLRSNGLFGTIPSDIPSIPSLKYLYLQHNNFSGEFPTTISPKLTALDLSFNSFSGQIPGSVRNLTHLAALYLQNNSFSGPLTNLDTLEKNLKLLNLSFNYFNGEIPLPLQRFPFRSYFGNALLCGQPLKRCSTPNSSDSSPPPPYQLPSSDSSGKRKNLSRNFIIAMSIAGSAILLIAIVAAVLLCLRRRRGGSGGKMGKGGGNNTNNNDKTKSFGSGVQGAEKNKLFFFEGSGGYSFDLEDLLRASAEVLGKGSFGTTYKAALEDGSCVVVKRLREVVVVGKKEFETQMEAIGKAEGLHPNVVPLKAYYYSKDEKLLVYNYFPAGSFSSLLHGNRGGGEGSRRPLGWEPRMKIIIGAARGIAHIHSQSDSGPTSTSTSTSTATKSVHGNIKASNVLLTADLDPCISDVGLAPLMNFPAATMSRTMGYRAPELLETRKPSQKSDVYSFGVLLLEALTGKSPIRGPGGGYVEEVVDLPRWVRSVVREEWTAEVFDAELVSSRSVEEDMVQMLQIALACVARAPEMRPTMDEVVKLIEDTVRPNAAERKSQESDNGDNNRRSDSEVETTPMSSNVPTPSNE